MRSSSSFLPALPVLPPGDWLARLHNPYFASFLRHANGPSRTRHLRLAARGRCGRRALGAVIRIAMVGGGAWVLLESVLGLSVF